MRTLRPTLLSAALLLTACSGSSPTDDPADAGPDDAGLDASTDGSDSGSSLACPWPTTNDGQGVCTTTLTRWSTWSGRPTSPGDDVTIPSGASVLLDGDAIVGDLVIRGELFVLDRPSTSLRVATIDIDGGSLRIGSPSQPFTGHLEVTFDDVLDRRFLVRDTGSVTIVGAAPVPSWTRLAADADTNATVLVVDAASGVHPGDRVAITPSDFYDFDVGAGGNAYLNNGPVAHTQLTTLASVSGTSLTLTDALTAPRYGTQDTVATDATLDERAEVAFLSRNIVFASADDAHFQTDDSGVVLEYVASGDLLLDGVEFRRAGIDDVVRGFPINLYGTGTATVAHSVITESVRGCVQLGGVIGATVEDNVCVDVLGHGLLVRAGSTGNVLRGNLISVIHYPSPTLAGETHQVDGNFGGASGVYSEEPLTEIRANTVSDTVGNGFWLSFDSLVLMTPFEDNVAHSMFGHGVLLQRWSSSADTAYEPTVNGLPGGAPAEVVFGGVSAWKNGKAGLFVDTPTIVLTDSRFADNGATSVEHYGYSSGPGGHATGNLFVHHSPNDATVSSFAVSAIGNRIASDVHGNTFIGYPAGPTSPGVLSQFGYSWNYAEDYLGTFGANTLIDSHLTWRQPAPGYGRLSAPAFDENGLLGPAGNFWVFDNAFVKDASCVPVTIGGMSNHVSCAGPYALLRDAAITTTTGPTTTLAFARIDAANANWATTLDDATPTHTLESNGIDPFADYVYVIANPATAIYLASVPGHASLAGVSKVTFDVRLPPGVLGANGTTLVAFKAATTDTFTVHFRWVWFNLDSANVPMAASLAALFAAPPNGALWYRDPATGYVFFRLYDFGYCPPAQPGCASGTPWYWGTGNGGLWELVIDVAH